MSENASIPNPNCISNLNPKTDPKAITLSLTLCLSLDCYFAVSNFILDETNHWYIYINARNPLHPLIALLRQRTYTYGLTRAILPTTISEVQINAKRICNIFSQFYKVSFELIVKNVCAAALINGYARQLLSIDDAGGCGRRPSKHRHSE